MRSDHKFKRWILWAAVILWMGMIFFLSAQTADQSSGLSGQTIRRLVTLFMPEFTEMLPLQQKEIVAELQSVVRNIAHIFTYMVLGMLSMAALLQHKTRLKSALTASLAFCTAYAVIDELHQYFVDGRAFEFIDIGLDFIGAAAGAGVIVIITRLARKKQEPWHVKQRGN